MTATPDGRAVLLLGGGGFIGANLAAELGRRGHRAIAAGRTGAGALPLADTDAILARVEAERVDTVVHLASTLIPSSTPADYLAEAQAVAIPTIRLARALAERGVRLAYLSSGGAIYGATSRPLAAEGDPCAPISLYGQAKLEMELHLDFLARTGGLRRLVVRPSNPYGPGQSLGGAQGLVSVILGRIAQGRALEVWGDGSGVRDYLYIDDAVWAIAGLIEREVEGVVNVGSGVGHSLLEVVAAAEAATGRAVPLAFRPGRPTDVPRLVLDVSRLAALGLRRARPLADGVRFYAARLGMAAGD